MTIDWKEMSRNSRMQKERRLVFILLLLAVLLPPFTVLSQAHANGLQTVTVDDYKVSLFPLPEHPAVEERVDLWLSIERLSTGEFLQGLEVKVEVERTIDGERRTVSVVAQPWSEVYYIATLTFTDEGIRHVFILFEVDGKLLTAEFVVHVMVSKPMEMMPGMPDWLFLSSSGFIVLASFFIIEVFGKKQPGHGYRKLDLLKIRVLERWVKSRMFQLSVRLPIVMLFLLIIFAGFFGAQVPTKNIATVLTWVIWWIILIFAVAIFGKVFCTVCPWLAMADWIQKGSFWKRVAVERHMSLNRRWPKRLKTVLVAAALFVILTWLELAWGVTRSPMGTAYLGFLILSLTILSMLLFERNYFCRYACPIGGVQGLYSLLSPVELKANDKGVCLSCRTKDCLFGNEKGYGCPTYLYTGGMDNDYGCILCSECVKTCPKDNVSFNVRPFATDLIRSLRASSHEALFAVILLALTSFHGLTMIPLWTELLASTSKFVGYIPSFTLWMILFLGALIGVVYSFTYISKLFSGERSVSVRTPFSNYGYSFLPIALFYHMAHNVAHFSMESQEIIPVISDPFGWGWNLFGTANMKVGQLLPMVHVWYIQVVLIVVGHILAIYVAKVVSRRIFADRKQAFRSQIPITILMVFYTMFSLWLTAQPMVMRTAM